MTEGDNCIQFVDSESLNVSPGGNYSLGSQVLGDLNGELAGDAGGAEYEKCFTFLQGGSILEREQSRHSWIGNRGCLCVIKAVREQEALGAGGHGTLRTSIPRVCERR